MSKEKAHELAEFVRGFINDGSSFVLHLRKRYKEDIFETVYNKFADEIESLGEQDSLPYPLDKDGIPIKLGETVYRADGKKPFEYQIYNNCGYDMIVETIFLYKDCIEITCNDYGRLACFEPEQLVHHKPRTLDDIIREMRNAYDEDELRISLIQEAYEMGKVANLDAPEDGIPWPLDKDGVPCKIGDIVFYKDYDFAIEYANDEYVVYSDYKGDMHEIKANEVTHKKPRTLDDIISDIMYSTEDGACDNLEEEINARMHEAYELGRKAAKDE